MRESRSASLTLVLILALGVALAALVPFLAALDYGFVRYDDYEYIVENPVVRSGLHAESVRWAFTTFTLSNWHPLTWLSYLVDVELFDVDARGFHLVSLLLHALNASLLFLLLHRLTAAPLRAAAVALLWGIHPLRVESVVWVSERKDVLSLSFALLAILAYLHYVRRRSRRWMALTALLMALGLMVKPMLVTLPILLLVLDFWPLGRPMKSFADLKRLLFEKWPLYPLSLVSGVVTILAQSDALADPEALPLALRLENAAVAIVQYLSNHLYPVDLAVLYPLETSHSPVLWLSCGVAILGLTLIFVSRLSSSPYLIAGWSWFLIALLPVLGILQVGSQARADRYTYLPSIGLFILLVFGIWAILRARLSERTAGVLGGTMLLLAAIACTVQTRHQTRYWSSSIVLFSHAIEVTGGSYAAHLNLGAELQRVGQTEAAIRSLRQAVERAPGLVGGHSNLASVLRQAGDLEGALRSNERALAVDPTSAKVRFNRAILLDDAERYEEVLTELANVMALAPDTPNLETALAAVIARLTPETTLKSLEASLALFPDNPQIRGLVEHLRRLDASAGSAKVLPTTE